MARSEMNPKITTYLSKIEKWRDELSRLRTIILDCDLTEEMKWGVPCYTFAKKNIVLIHGFKNYCAILFVKGALLKDPNGVLIQQTENVQAGRQIRFTNVQDIAGIEAIVKAYIREAVEVEQLSLTVNKKKTTEFAVPGEFQRRLDGSPQLKSAFEVLTPGRQRAYLFYFSSAKQSKTREARVEKYIPKILNGKGMDD